MLLTTITAMAAITLAAPPAAPAQTRPLDIVDTAIAAGSFDTLAAALTAADLVDTLKGPGPFTVFAPTDRAFAKIPAEKLQRLLAPENKQELTELLTFHVVGGDLFAADVVQASGAVSLNGQKIDFTVPTAGPILIDGSVLQQTDILCKNGVIHVIDTVMLPATDNLVATVVGGGVFNTLVAAVQAAGLVDLLSGSDDYTVFAPTDRAFAKLPAGTVDMLLLPENLDKLVALLKNHVVAGRVYSEDVVAVPALRTIGGGALPVALVASGVTVSGAQVQAVDLDASNGVVHVVDQVLIPTR